MSEIKESSTNEEQSNVQAEETPIKEQSSCEMGTSCDLYTDFTNEDEKLLEKIELTAEQLKLKETDKNAFWKSVAETFRVDLSDALADNEDTHNIKNAMKSENKSLLKDCARLEKLAKEAQEIVNQLSNMI